LNTHNQYCISRETDYTQDKEIRKILNDGINSETILSTCQLIKQKENSPVIKLPSDIDLWYLSGNKQITDIIAATELICCRDYKILLDCIDKLRGTPIMLKVNGAFSTLLSLTGSEFLFRQMIKSETEITAAINRINTNTVTFIKEAVLHGVNIISYADPSAVSEVIGEKLHYKYSIKATYDFMCLARPYLSGSIMHLCPRTSFALEKYMLCFFDKHHNSHNNLINELLVLSQCEDIHFTGHVCVNADKHLTDELYILNELQPQG